MLVFLLVKTLLKQRFYSIKVLYFKHYGPLSYTLDSSVRNNGDEVQV